MAHNDTTPRDRHRFLSYVVGRWVPILLIVLAVVFVTQNRDRVSIDLFWLQVSAPLWLILLVAVLAGVLIGVLSKRGRPSSSA